MSRHFVDGEIADPNLNGQIVVPSMMDFSGRLYDHNSSRFGMPQILELTEPPVGKLTPDTYWKLVALDSSRRKPKSTRSHQVAAPDSSKLKARQRASTSRSKSGFSPR